MAEPIKKETGKWNPPKTKSKRSEMPAHVFLLPKERKFPYKKKVNGKWKISCKGVLAAYRRARQHGYAAVAAKAKRIYMKYCAKKKKKK